MPPKILGLCLVHLVSVALKTAPWKHGLQLQQNVTEQQGQFGQVPPENIKQIFSFRNRHAEVAEAEVLVKCAIMQITNPPFHPVTHLP